MSWAGGHRKAATIGNLGFPVIYYCHMRAFAFVHTYGHTVDYLQPLTEKEKAWACSRHRSTHYVGRSQTWPAAALCSYPGVASKDSGESKILPKGRVSSDEFGHPLWMDRRGPALKYIKTHWQMP